MISNPLFVIFITFNLAVVQDNPKVTVAPVTTTTKGTTVTAVSTTPTTPTTTTPTTSSLSKYFATLYRLYYFIHTYSERLK